ncbi:acyl carrier protein [Enterobacteriaceae endosymbiont of Donacia bicoloricornis]|uniref:acyl carrier protein n=1 Tax=Enterobacteriaceae endosymbiont of Donacia bicoloricornis TaxID=2675772 RepID=UPI001449CF54|nr:acyl carrier protein [Enterobacteriaceae endosymbiont of Donacia bicoloricornis]QJC37623.1 acyl carrier protein [Enterobacteriaceae endosymbiont of Donacia bicoloricornis]
MNNSITKRVKKIIIDQLGIKKKHIINSSSFKKDLGADSLDTIEIMMALEEEFNIEILDEDAEKITTIQEAINYINNYKK